MVAGFAALGRFRFFAILLVGSFPNSFSEDEDEEEEEEGSSRSPSLRRRPAFAVGLAAGFRWSS